jgi:hypothetical protein
MKKKYFINVEEVPDYVMANSLNEAVKMAEEEIGVIAEDELNEIADEEVVEVEEEDDEEEIEEEDEIRD